MLVGAMKWLVTKRFLVPSQIEIRPKQHVKCDLAKEVVRDARVPNGLGTFVNARVEHRERAVELIRDQLLECVEHWWSPVGRITFDDGWRYTNYFRLGPVRQRRVLRNPSPSAPATTVRPFREPAYMWNARQERRYESRQV